MSLKNDRPIIPKLDYDEFSNKIRIQYMKQKYLLKYKKDELSEEDIEFLKKNSYEPILKGFGIDPRTVITPTPEEIENYNNMIRASAAAPPDFPKKVKIQKK